MKKLTENPFRVRLSFMRLSWVQDGIIKTLFTLITITEICLKNRQVTRQAKIFQMFRNGYSTEKSKIVLHKLLTI